LTALVGVFGYGGGASPLLEEPAMRRMLAAARMRGGTVARIHREGAAILSVAHSSCDVEPPANDPTGIASDDECVVIADASLYYQQDLRRAIGPTAARARTPAQLILSAYRAFGEQCVERLEGDFAFVVWHRTTGRVFCARDFAGRRPLYVAEIDGAVVVASDIASITSHPSMSAAPNLAVVGADAAAMIFSIDDETAIRGVRSLRAGWTLSIEHGSLQTRRYWHARVREMSASAREIEEGAAELRALLMDAVRERFDLGGPTTVWMSGGRDSTAVFAAGQQAIRERRVRGPLLPVSRSDPVGDVGREDDVINEVAAFWGVSPRWVDAGAVRMFAGAEAGASTRPQPFAQPFGNLTRALAQGTRSLGSRVALDGYGGDFLFQVSQIFLADLVARGRLTTAVREWRAMDRQHEGWRGFARWSVLPALPAWTRRALAVARGRPQRAHFDRALPPWMDARFVHEHGLVERAMALGVDAQSGATRAARETSFYFSHPQFARINAMMGEFALEHGVELRSPLLDERVVLFALSRPREERNLGGDRKRLIRQAMRGLLPERALAPRPFKTGTLASYFAREMQRDGITWIAELRNRSTLAEHGIVDRAALERAVDEFVANPTSFPNSEALFCTLQAELWLRARTSEPTGLDRGSSWNVVGGQHRGSGAHV
jgi:asparagine synthase (glutamine-hydrolysing)